MTTVGERGPRPGVEGRADVGGESWMCKAPPALVPAARLEEEEEGEDAGTLRELELEDGDVLPPLAGLVTGLNLRTIFFTVVNTRAATRNSDATAG